MSKFPSHFLVNFIFLHFSFERLNFFCKEISLIATGALIAPLQNELYLCVTPSAILVHSSVIKHAGQFPFYKVLNIFLGDDSITK